MPSSTKTSPPRLSHLSALDGLRGVAVAAVLVFHLNPTWLPGGFFGVDLFFVLSGFLITTLLLDEHFATGEISLSGFFFRRILRLYPGLVALVVMSTVFALARHRDTDLGRTLSIDTSVLLYYANWLSMADTKGWFGGMPHTWSLAIEGQFYLLWAVTLTSLARRYPEPEKRSTLLKALTLVAAGIVIFSATWRAVLWHQGAPWLRPYLGTDSRLDSVFIGVLVALARFQWFPAPESAPTNVVAASLVETVCAGVVAYLLATVEFGTALPGYVGFTLVSLATAGLLVSVLRHPVSLWSAILRWPPLVWLGKISYSLYLWHVPVVKVLPPERLIAAGLPAWLAECVRLTVCILTAAVSYYLIEKTFLRWKHRRSVTFSPTAAKVPTSSSD